MEREEDKYFYESIKIQTTTQAFSHRLTQIESRNQMFKSQMQIQDDSQSNKVSEVNRVKEISKAKT